MPLWNFSAPASDALHWKNMIPSAPRAIDWKLPSRICPGCFAAFR
jgi:hypothetical protein